MIPTLGFAGYTHRDNSQCHQPANLGCSQPHSAWHNDLPLGDILAAANHIFANCHRPQDFDFRGRVQA